MQLFDQLARGVIGANQLYDLQKTLAATVKSNNSFPFYNIKKIGDNQYKIEFALAGYSLGDLDITVEKNKLTVSGTGSTVDPTEFLYHGFASRKFSKQFVLMDNVRVNSADFVNGILSIILEEFVKDEDKPKKINIGAPKESAHPQLLNEESSF